MKCHLCIYWTPENGCTHYAPENSLTTTHSLDFFSCEHEVFTNHSRYKIGTCKGIWGCTGDAYYILSITNSRPGNGHLDDVFEWFEHAAKRDNKNLLVLECFNKKFYHHLISKRAFISMDADKENVIKVYNKKFYRQLLKKGNEIIIAGSFKCI